MFDFAAPAAKVNADVNSAPNTTQNTNGAGTDDDWNFSSALPEDSSLPTATTVTVSDKEVAIIFEVTRRKTDESVLEIMAKFSNKSAKAITEYTFQVAVTRVYTAFVSNERCLLIVEKGLLTEADSAIRPKAPAVSVQRNHAAS